MEYRNATEKILLIETTPTSSALLKYNSRRRAFP